MEVADIVNAGFLAVFVVVNLFLADAKFNNSKLTLHVANKLF